MLKLLRQGRIWSTQSESALAPSSATPARDGQIRRRGIAYTIERSDFEIRQGDARRGVEATHAKGTRILSSGHQQRDDKDGET